MKPQHFFSGTSYLGISNNETFRAYLVEGLIRWGNHYGGSRLSPNAPEVYEEGEAYIAEWTNKGEALLLSSGTLCGQLLLQYFSQQKGEFIYSPNYHIAAQTKGLVMKTWEEWKEAIIKASQNSSPTILVSNTIDPLLLKPTPLDWIATLPEDKEWIVLLDESHSIGVLGKEGIGLASNLKVAVNVQIIVMSSLAKACGIHAGFISGDKTMISNLRQMPLFGGASPPAPAFVSAFLKSKALYQNARTSLQTKIEYFIRNINPQTPLKHLPRYPVFKIQDARLTDYLQEKGITISSFSYPSPSDALLNRIVLNADHTYEELDILIEAINHF